MADVIKNGASRDQSGVARCLHELRAMVLSGELLPGQKLTQGDLAERLNVSRIPIREALATLHAEGLLDHKPNTGFTVARFSSEDLSEIYLMRRLLETELLGTIDFDKLDFDKLKELNDQMGEAAGHAEAPEVYQELNMAFHFTFFEASPLELVRQELARLWHMSAFYRSLYLYEEGMYPQLQKDHQRIVAAAKKRDSKRLIEMSDQHRTHTERMVVQRVRRRPTTV